MDAIGANPTMTPRFVPSPEPPLIDEPVGARLVGLDPGERVRITATCADALAISFESWAEFEVDGSGAVDPSRQPALSGTYQGEDPFGLWSSMASPEAHGFTMGLDPVPTMLVAELPGGGRASHSFDRRPMGRGVRSVPVREGGLVAHLFAPARQPAPGVVVLGGSGGGFHWSAGMAALLASRGFAALAVAYFGLAGLPPALVGLPLERVETALHWLAGQREVVRPGPVAVVGGSRGAEAALLLATMVPEVGAVVGFAASGVVWAGFEPDRADPQPAWTRRGTPVPYRLPEQELVDELLTTSPIALSGAYLPVLETLGRDDDAIIPVEEIRGPVLLVSGEDDRMWPSTALSEIAMRRLARHRHPHPDLHLHYPGAGHSVGWPPGLPASGGLAVHPGDGDLYALGGTRAGNAAANADAWRRVLDFLREHLGTGERAAVARDVRQAPA